MAEKATTGEASARGAVESPHASGTARSPDDDDRRTAEAAKADLRKLTWLLAGIFGLALLCTLYFASAIFMPIALALLLNLLLSPVVKALSLLRLPTAVGAALVLLCLAAGVLGAVFTLSEPALTWADRVPTSLYVVEHKIRSLQETVEEVKKTTEKVEEITDIKGGADAQEVVVKGPNLTETLVSGTWHFAASTMMTVVLLFFLLSSGDTFLRKIIKMSPSFKDKRKVLLIARNTQREISNYLLTITAVNMILGAITAVALYFLDLPNALLWGVVAGLLNFIPYLGALAMAGVLFLVSLVTFHAWFDILLPPAVFLCLTALEGQIVTPSLLGRRLSLNPVFVFLALIICGWMWGIFGLFIAVPLLVACKIVCDHSDGLTAVAELLSGRAEGNAAEGQP
ncbi:MAG TPA: AI-2E family transporter [Kiloniellaceae bacterium]|nr:AI-2E family transporter [Kiloniellaceae bacterium]